MSTSQWKVVLDKLADRGVMNIAFTGGEALMRDDMFELLEYANNLKTEHIETVDGELQSEMKRPKLYLLSNGLNVDDSVLQRLKDLDVQLSVSLPGLTTFSRHTGIDNVDGVLDLFTRAKRLDMTVVVNITVTKWNLHELRETIGAALLAGASQILLNRFLPGGRGLSHAEDLTLSADEVCQALDIAEEVLQQADRYGSLGTEIPRCLTDPAKYERLTVSTQCAAAIGFFVIGPSGYIRVCNHSPVRLTHVDQLDEVKLDPYWKQFAMKDYLPDACGDCRLRCECDAGCREAAHIVGGSVDAIDDLATFDVADQ